MKKKYFPIILISVAFFLVFALNAKPTYLLENKNIDKIVISNIYDADFSIIIDNENGINQLVSLFDKYNLKKNKAEPIDSIMQYKVKLYENNILVVTIELNLLDKESDWAYNVCRIFSIDEHKYYKLPDDFIKEITNYVNSH